MRFPPSLLDEIRARLPVSEVVGKRVRLQKAGREYKGLSPFNAEKTPSFFVNDQKGFFHDFSSGMHGDIFRFVMETEGLAFPEAVEKLAGLAGVALPVASREAVEHEQRQKSLTEVMELAAAFFRGNLEGRVGSAARAYCESRGLTAEVRKRFGLGYGPGERFALRDHLAGKGVPAELMLEVGLLSQGEDRAVAIDRFRDRLMFPIADMRGRVIAFGGRALSKEVSAKYLNSPETPIFHKGHVVYNHHNARAAARDRGTVIVVEGYVDVIAISEAGFPNAVAPLGTALTADQLALVWRMTEEPLLCFDGDKAGRRAAYRAIDTALPLIEAGKSLRFALLPDGQDPDDLARHGGKPALDRVFAGALSLADLLWARETEAGPLDTPERRAGLEKRIREILSVIKDESLKRHYRAEFDQRLAALLPAPARGGRDSSMRSQGGGIGRRGDPRALPSGPPRASERLTRSPLFSQAPRMSPREAFILSLFVRHPGLMDDHADDLAMIELRHPDCIRLRSLLLAWDATAPLRTREAFASFVAGQGGTELVASVVAAVHFGDHRRLDLEAQPDAVRESLRQAMTLHHRALTLHRELAAAEAAFAQDASEANLALLRELRDQVSTLDGTEADLERIGQRGSSDTAAPGQDPVRVGR